MLGSRFTRQAWALAKKNWLIMSKHWLINLLRCLILPIAYAVFFAKASQFFTQHNVYGSGSPVTLQNVDPSLDGRKFIWVPPVSALYNPTQMSFTQQYMDEVIDSLQLDSDARSRVQMITNASDVISHCPTNLALQSDCFAAVVLTAIDPVSDVLAYTMRGDTGLAYVNVEDHTSNVETHFLPVQWAVESTFIGLKTGVTPARPREWPYTRQTNAGQAEANRQQYLGGIESLVVLALFLVLVGAPYQLAGGVAQERVGQLTSHLEAMGCLKASRAISWHLSVALVYLPAWIVTAIVWRLNIFTHTNWAFFILAIVFCATSLMSFSMLVAAPFANRAPTLAAISSVFLAIILAVAALLTRGLVVEIVFGFIFPPTLFIYIFKALCSFERHGLTPSMTDTSPARDIPLIALLIIAIFDTIFFPMLALWVESRLYDARPADARWWQLTRRSHRHEASAELGPDVAIQIDHLRKVYPGRRKRLRKQPVVAVDDLTLTIPANKIFCLLGRNGSGKTTTLGILSRLISPSQGTIRYNSQHRLGIGPQKNVLFDELTCRQHLRIWHAIKMRKGDPEDETIESLLQRCDLAGKMDAPAGTLSGGQKRKLQLAIALVGGSNLLLLDEISSGLDSLARRAIWRVILSYQGQKTVIMTTHFLDESDFLADEVAIIKTPGRLVAQDTPQDLKANHSDQQFGVRLSFVDAADPALEAKALERELQAVIPQCKLISSAYNDYQVDRLAGLQEVAAIAKYLEAQGREDLDFEVSSPTLEDVFLRAVSDDTQTTAFVREIDVDVKIAPREIARDTVASSLTDNDDAKDIAAGSSTALSEISKAHVIAVDARPPDLHSGKPTGPFGQAWTITRKRLLILRRAWPLPLLAILVAIMPSAIPLSFVSQREQTCAFVYEIATANPLTFPLSYLSGRTVLTAPPGATSNISSIYNITRLNVQPDEQAFVTELESRYRRLAYGGFSLADDGQPSLFAYEASSLRNIGLSVLNMLNNVYLDRYSGANGYNIVASFSFFPGPDFSSTADGIKWIAFFSLALAVWPAFFALYPCGERAARVQANQYSNGMRPAGLWLGHLLFELPSIFLVATVLTIIFASPGGHGQFHDIGLLWLCLFLYGIASCLFSYVFTLFLRSQLAVFALFAGYNVIIFLLYLAAYLLTLTYDQSTKTASHINLEHFTIAIISPVCSIIRAALVSINMFALLCDGYGNYTTASKGSMVLFGGPIVYLIAWSLVCFGILVWVDSGAPRPRFGRKRVAHGDNVDSVELVRREKDRVEQSDDPLRVLNLRKSFGSNVAVDDVTFGVKRGDTFALLGPNGAGKTTTLSCVKGDLQPDGGDVLLEGRSIIRDRVRARAKIGMCPQINPIDATLTVRQHLLVYGRLKGLKQRDLQADIAVLLAASGLDVYADRAAKDLSGGNQRKLCLALSLIGGPSILLVDEYSSGVDPTSRRDNWAVLKAMTRDKALVFTTHSMEEVQALASRAAIIARTMLAVGSLTSLKTLFGSIYELHLRADRVAEAVAVVRRQGFDAHVSQDTASRIEVSLDNHTFADLLEAVETVKRELDIRGVAISPLSIESVFMKVVRQHNVQEENHAAHVVKAPWYKRLFARK